MWDLWTTPEGIEFWRAPDGFTVEVEKFELEPGGELVYTMTATAPEQVESDTGPQTAAGKFLLHFAMSLDRLHGRARPRAGLAGRHSFHSGLTDEYVADKGAVLRGRDRSDAAREKPAQGSS